MDFVISPVPLYHRYPAGHQNYAKPDPRQLRYELTATLRAKAIIEELHKEHS